jgi:cytosine/adenosine deaminase-related metal-dependent hydrolase
MSFDSANNGTQIVNDVRLAGKPTDSRWDISCKDGSIDSITEYAPSSPAQNSSCRFLAPSLCHPHIHLDKCFLLSHPKYADLKIKKGDFAEAMKLTSEAKSRFEHDDLVERGRALIKESIGFGVTHMRAFVEVDEGVGLKCLEAGLALKDEFHDRCYVQLCVFAQDPIFSYDDGGETMRKLLEEGIQKPGVEAVGSTPYVETNGDYEAQIKNMEWAITKAKQFKLHLDFHIDYNLDSTRRSMIPEAIQLLHSIGWPSDPDSLDFRTIVFGHCTRLTLFSREEWMNLRDEIRDLPISFVGLPTSDLFMMGRPNEDAGGGQRARGTLQVPQMIQKYVLNAAIGINNVGNAFTPHGSCDPLSLASLGVGVYQAGTEEDADILLVSNRI